MDLPEVGLLALTTGSSGSMKLSLPFCSFVLEQSLV